MSRMGVPNRRGVSAIYMLIILSAMVALSTLAVDWGHVQVTKTELRVAADAAARAAAATIPNGKFPSQNEAIAFAKKNIADGKVVDIDRDNDITYGKWDTKTRTFTPFNGSDITDTKNCNAVKVTTRRIAAHGDAVSLIWGKLLGQETCDVQATCIAMLIPGINVDQNVPATANPFLSGATPGTVVSSPNPHRSPDRAGNSSDVKQSPIAVNMAMTEGLALTFDSIHGTARHDPNLAYFNPDGELTDIGHNNLTTDHNGNYSNRYYNENGIADVRAPINSLVGVFLGDENPANTAAPANLDFSTAASRNFSSLHPELKQIFFIGDGLDSDGLPQTFVAPKGATKLYLATWDFYEWNNNAGYRNVKVIRPQQVIVVQ